MKTFKHKGHEAHKEKSSFSKAAFGEMEFALSGVEAKALGKSFRIL